MTLIRERASGLVAFGLAVSVASAGPALAGSASLFGLDDPLADRLVDACAVNLDEMTLLVPEYDYQLRGNYPQPNVHRLLAQYHLHSTVWAGFNLRDASLSELEAKIAEIENWKPRDRADATQFAIRSRSIFKCMLHLLRDRAGSASPASAPDPPSPPAQAPAPLPPGVPGPATTAALNAALSASGSQPSPQPTTKGTSKPVPPTLTLLTNTGTACAQLHLENFRTDESGTHWVDWVLTNKCPTFQLVIAQVGPDRSGSMFGAPGLAWYGSHPGWTQKQSPSGLGFAPVSRDDWMFLMSPSHVSRGTAISHSGEKHFAWLASCEAYKDGFYQSIFRAAQQLGRNPSVACVKNLPGAPR